MAEDPAGVVVGRPADRRLLNERRWQSWQLGGRGVRCLTLEARNVADRHIKLLTSDLAEPRSDRAGLAVRLTMS
jgi:hypothetical protein